MNKKQLSRAKLSEFIAKQSSCTLYMEACGSAHHWARCFEEMGHAMNPPYVKPFVKGQKNDVRDAQAIMTACTQPDAVFVPKKSIGQQNLQSIHRIRSSLVKRDGW